MHGAKDGGIRHLDRWQSRVIAALRVEGRACMDDSKVRGANGVPRRTRGSNPFGRQLPLLAPLCVKRR
jgi:hypothetical protein